jgi:hypothetical protein
MPILKNIPVLALMLSIVIGTCAAAAPFAQFDRPDSTAGYLARLLVNETPFPGERAYESEADTKGAMLQVLWVLHCRLHFIPKGYTQQQVAGVRSGDIIDVITGTGGRRQCEGFYRNAAGQFVTEPRVEERLNNLLQIANSGGKPGRFAALLNYAQGLAQAYVKEGIEGADRFAPGHGACLLLDDGCGLLPSRRQLRQHSVRRGGFAGRESFFHFEKGA